MNENQSFHSSALSQQPSMPPLISPFWQSLLFATTPTTTTTTILTHPSIKKLLYMYEVCPVCTPWWKRQKYIAEGHKPWAHLWCRRIIPITQHPLPVPPPLPLSLAACNTVLQPWCVHNKGRCFISCAISTGTAVMRNNINILLTCVISPLGTGPAVCCVALFVCCKSNATLSMHLTPQCQEKVLQKSSQKKSIVFF